MKTIEIKKIADLHTILGKAGSKAIRETRKCHLSMKSLPTKVSVRKTQPKFNITEGSSLHIYLIDMTTSEIKGDLLGSTNDFPFYSVMAGGVMISRGQRVPMGLVGLFIQAYWNGRNTIWDLTIVDSNYKKHIFGGTK